MWLTEITLKTDLGSVRLEPGRLAEIRGSTGVRGLFGVGIGQVGSQTRTKEAEPQAYRTKSF